MNKQKNDKLPEWTSPYNLAKHYDKRVKADQGCFESAIGVSAPMSLTQYEERRKAVCRNPGMVYRCKQWNPDGNSFHDRSLYMVDKDLILVILKPQGKEVLTCYHKHIPFLSCPKQEEQSPGANLLELRRHLENLRDAKKQSVSRLKFVKDPRNEKMD